MRPSDTADLIVATRKAKGLHGINPNLDKYKNPPKDAHSVISPSEITDRVIARALRGIWGAKLPWAKTHSHIRFAPGQVTIVAGALGSFKSSALSQVVIGLAEQNFRICVTSLEEPIEEYGWRMAKQLAANSSPDENQIGNAFESLHERLWFWDVHGEMAADRALAMMAYCAYDLNIEHFVFDNFTCVINPSNEAVTEQWEFIRRAVRLARDSGMHIYIVMHTRKGIHDNRDRPPTVDDIRGSSTIAQQVDQVIMAWRNIKKEDAINEAGSVIVDGKDLSSEPDLTLLCEKAKFTGWRGRVKLWSRPREWQFVESGAHDALPSTLLG